MLLTRLQREALKRVWQRTDQTLSYRQFRRLVVQPNLNDYVLVPYCGMWLGIEPDGYTHS
jgi:hypothetical protein